MGRKKASSFTDRNGKYNMKNNAIKVLELNSFYDDPSEITKIIQRLFKYQAELGSAILDQYDNSETQFISVTLNMEQIEPFWLKFLDLERFTNGDLPVFCCEDCGCHYSSCSNIYPYTYRDNNGVVGRSYECEVCKTFDCKTIGEIAERNQKEGPLVAKKHALSLLTVPQHDEVVSEEIVPEHSKPIDISNHTFSGTICVDRIPQLMDMLANNAWYGLSPQSIQLTAGENVIVLDGYVYEPGYEDFSSTSSITLNGYILYGYDSRNADAYRNEVYQTGIHAKLDDAISDLKAHISDQVLQIDASISTENSCALTNKIDAALFKSSFSTQDCHCTESNRSAER